MVWSVSFNQQLMSAHCGGGHRSWGCCRDNDMLRFVYLKTGKVCLVDSGYQTKQIILQVNFDISARQQPIRSQNNVEDPCKVLPIIPCSIFTTATYLRFQRALFKYGALLCD